VEISRSDTPLVNAESKETIMGSSSLLREKIPWFPTMNYDLCKGTKECLTFCPSKVFTWDEVHARTIVANPFSCTVGCSNCVRICPNQTITFPDMEELAATLKRLRSEMQQKPADG
jgi:NAD-dependent dihydropyrimidine dehydrogenase PreA subunit